MVNVYVSLIIRGLRKLSTVPDKLRIEVEDKLKLKLGVDELPENYK